MDVPFDIPDLDGGDGVDGVFVKGEKKFMISDDLQVKPVSMSASLALLNKLGVDNEDVLEKRTVEFGRPEILSLLKRLLVSMTPLTDVFLEESNIVADAEKSVLTETSHARENPQMATTESKRIGVKLFLSKDSDKVVYAEAAEDFVDLLFSFLTFPLGSIVKILEKRSSIGCIDNLYHSVEILSSEDGYIKSINHKCMLLEPKLAPYFGCSNQLLRVDEKLSEITKACSCLASPCFHGAKRPSTCEMNPKLKKPEYFGGGFARSMVAFMVTDEMLVAPFSPISGISIINKLMVPISSLKEAKAVIGEAEATDLLRACLVSRTILTDIFSPAHLVTLLEKKWCGQFLGN